MNDKNRIGMQIKVFGERNSGNNYLMELLRENFNKKNVLSRWSERHEDANGTPKPEDDTTLFLILVKNPYSWLLSMHRNLHSEKTFMEFIQSEFEGHKTPMDLWNFKYNTYLEKLSDHKHFVIRYEDLLKNYDVVLSAIKYEFRLEAKHSKMVNVLNETKSNGGLERTRFNRKEYYLQEQWKEDINPVCMDLIKLSLSKKLLKDFKYERCI